MSIHLFRSEVRNLLARITPLFDCGTWPVRAWDLQKVAVFDKCVPMWNNRCTHVLKYSASLSSMSGLLMQKYLRCIDHVSRCHTKKLIFAIWRNGAIAVKADLERLLELNACACLVNHCACFACLIHWLSALKVEKSKLYNIITSKFKRTTYRDDGIVARAAADENEASTPHYVDEVIFQTPKSHREIVEVNATPHCVQNRLRLLKDFLLHKVIVVAWSRKNRQCTIIPVKGWCTEMFSHLISILFYYNWPIILL